MGVISNTTNCVISSRNRNNFLCRRFDRRPSISRYYERRGLKMKSQCGWFWIDIEMEASGGRLRWSLRGELVKKRVQRKPGKKRMCRLHLKPSSDCRRLNGIIAFSPRSPDHRSWSIAVKTIPNGTSVKRNRAFYTARHIIIFYKLLFTLYMTITIEISSVRLFNFLYGASFIFIKSFF